MCLADATAQSNRVRRSGRGSEDSENESDEANKKNNGGVKGEEEKKIAVDLYLSPVLRCQLILPQFVVMSSQ